MAFFSSFLAFTHRMLQTRWKWTHHLFSRSLTTHSHNLAIPETDLPAMVRTLCAQNKLHDALSLFYISTNTTPPSPNTLSQAYAILVQTCAHHRQLSDGQTLHRHMLSLNHQPSVYLSNHLINMYAKCGHLDLAHNLFDEMPQRNLVSWTALISGYDQQGLANDCFLIFSRMLSHDRPSEFAFASVLGSCDSRRGPQDFNFAVLGFEQFNTSPKCTVKVLSWIVQRLLALFPLCVVLMIGEATLH